ncbi:ferritin-like domain-containing protein [Sporolactobacillus sp. Y61]|uniref:Ferritin-like domain-containing protein n=1 Tax=Sporolactobacillus sp. Y61 TaxID=3160863 RepID=A0AAU8IF17_9BACL|nr:ferritin-like domain-containing protein [Sporolactobacillus sp. THM19-2]RYL94513.1 ferritin-like domain-containing protein [Sporolactobacillus sp. THM19-2]
MDKKLQTLVDGLNKDLAGEYSAVIQYNYYATTVSGLNYQILKPFFEAEIPDELGHAAYLSEKIANLGGEPTTVPAPVKKVTEAKAMLEEARKAEADTLENYKQRRSQAQELGLIELVVKLEDMIADEQSHFEKLAKTLKDPLFA